ncbi:NAD(P)H-dependent oxidoreductase [Mycoplasmatota bacterium zrk1]
MKKILYITANTKPEKLSTSKTVSRIFIDKIKDMGILTELDLYDMHIPEINYKYFQSRATLVKGNEYLNLTEDEQKDVAVIDLLADQFITHDTYVIAAPMWGLSFPSKLKQYFDCVLINGKTLSITDESVEGLLTDEERHAVYIQSSGGDYPQIMSRQVNHGLTYLKDILKFLGVKGFHPILIEGTEMKGIGKEKAMEEAISQMDKIIKKIT